MFSTSDIHLQCKIPKIFFLLDYYFIIDILLRFFSKCLLGILLRYCYEQL